MAGEVRQRRGTKKKQSKASAPAASKEKKAEEQTAAPEEQTAWQIVKDHPLAMVLPIVLIPYSVYLAFLFFQLQRPDIVASSTLGMVQLRPAISNTDERQLLIVGTMSSGTVQVASDLREHLDLEVGHEVSDADWNFVRDGTVSWFHGIRFMDPLELKDLVFRWRQLCGNYTENMGFHPNMYSSACSSRKKWGKCWSSACFEILRKEWGCAFSQCETPFRTSLLQLRHPMRTLESLVTKFCQGGLNGTVHPSFLTYASALFPRDYEDDSCIEAISSYLMNYNQVLIKAYSKGLIEDMYRIEETSPCSVAHLSGLMDHDKTVYPPNYDKVAALCGDTMSAANQFMESTRHKVNLGQVSLKWDDLHGGTHGSHRAEGDTALEKSMRVLTKKLGYDENQEYATDSEFN